jgi:hypothetical protein
MDGNDTARRVRAARALAGLDSVQALAAAINQRGLSTKTLRAIEQGRRIAEPRELTAIAEACGLTPGFFRMDLQADAREGGRARLETAERQLASLWENITELRRELGEVRSQVEHLTQEALARREREAVEQEKRRRDAKQGTADVEDGR